MSSLPYSRSLDGVRGLAVLLVVVCHQTICVAQSRVEAGWFTFQRLGWVGVDLFFVLSGMLITTILLQQRGTKDYYRNFFARRALRIVPLYYVILFLFFYVVPLLPKTAVKNLEPLSHSTFWFWGFLSNFLIAWHGRWIQPPLSASWSLAIEEQFYLVWPFLVARLNVRALRNSCVLIIVAAEVIRTGLALTRVSPIAIYVLPFTRADTIAFGALIAIYRFQSPSALALWSRWTGKILALSATVGLGITWFLGRDSFGMAVGGYLAIAIASAAAVAGTVSGSRRFLSWFDRPFFVAVGKRSYAIYLLHVPVVGLIATLVFDPNQFSSPATRILGQIAFQFIATLVTLALSQIAYWGVESHFLKLKRFFSPPVEQGAEPERLVSNG